MARVRCDKCQGSGVVLKVAKDESAPEQLQAITTEECHYCNGAGWINKNYSKESK